MKLNILEQVPLYKGNTAEATLKELTTLAQLADQLGYKRFWLAEHHNTPAFLSSAPDILAGHLLANTEKIRVGTGGVMAMHYGSLQIAERFNLLATLYPDRVDMGLGRAPGTDLATARALNQTHLLSPVQINQIIEETLHFIRGDFEETHPYRRFKVTPQPEILPEAWLLGSSGQSAAWAGEKEMYYAYAQFFTGHQDEDVMDHYRQFFPSDSKLTPNTLSALSIVAAETQEEADKLALTMQEFRYRLENGFSVVFRSPEEIMADGEEYVEKIRQYTTGRNNAIIGTYQEVADKIKQFAEEFHTDEIMLITYIADFEIKQTIYREMAKRLIK